MQKTIYLNDRIIELIVFLTYTLIMNNLEKLIIRITIGMKECKEYNIMIPVGVYSNGEVIDLHIDDLTEKERLEYEAMVKDYKPTNNKIYQ